MLETIEQNIITLLMITNKSRGVRTVTVLKIVLSREIIIKLTIVMFQNLKRVKGKKCSRIIVFLCLVGGRWRLKEVIGLFCSITVDSTNAKDIWLKLKANMKGREERITFMIMIVIPF